MCHRLFLALFDLAHLEIGIHNSSFTCSLVLFLGLLLMSVSSSRIGNPDKGSQFEEHNGFQRGSCSDHKLLVLTNAYPLPTREKLFDGVRLVSFRSGSNLEPHR